VPKKPGKFRTPDVTLSFFDPVQGQYRTLEHKGAPLTVEGRALSDMPLTTSGDGQDIGPILTDPALTHHDMSHFAGSALFWMLILLPLGLLIAVEIGSAYRRRLARDPSARRARGAGKQAAKRLRRAQETLEAGDVKAFFGEVARTFIGYFEEKANIPATGLTRDALSREAERVGYPAELMEGVVAELENCDYARFAPAATMQTQMRETCDRAEKLLARLDKIKPRRTK